jgi:hypothetical protein
MDLIRILSARRRRTVSMIALAAIVGGAGTAAIGSPAGTADTRSAASANHVALDCAFCWD